MRTLIWVAGLILSLAGGVTPATDVINQDNREYEVKVQGEGNLSISYYTVHAGGSLYGLCGYAFCTFEIPGSNATANKDERLTIRDGRFLK